MNLKLGLFLTLGLVTAVCVCDAADSLTTYGSSLVLSTRVALIQREVWSNEDPHPIDDDSPFGGDTYKVVIEHWLKNISKQKIVAEKVAPWMMRNHWNFNFGEAVYSGPMGPIEGPPACDLCGNFTSLDPSASVLFQTQNFHLPSIATAAVYRSIVVFRNDGHTCGTQAWTGTLIADLSIVFTNALQNVPPPVPAKSPSSSP